MVIQKSFFGTHSTNFKQIELSLISRFDEVKFCVFSLKICFCICWLPLVCKFVTLLANTRKHLC